MTAALTTSMIEEVYIPQQLAMRMLGFESRTTWSKWCRKHKIRKYKLTDGLLHVEKKQVLGVAQSLRVL